MPLNTFAGFTNDGFILKFSKNFSGNVAFTVSVSNGCGVNSVFTDDFVGNCNSLNTSIALKSSQSSTVFKVHPNPTNNIVYINLVDANNIPYTGTQIKASLHDMFGVEKENIKFKNNFETTINVSEFKSGLYVLTIWFNNTIETHLISVK
ncbi:T9SS type A sorting domain-containing protein [Mariniflexile jejuense]|uniref:T9SS type A sorting domain-containing protein n=1 Tax=Mariniflexile jejuense TaxID=1173582 RepID=A0ABW3JKI2_9FLAO